MRCPYPSACCVMGTMFRFSPSASVHLLRLEIKIYKLKLPFCGLIRSTCFQSVPHGTEWRRTTVVRYGIIFFKKTKLSAVGLFLSPFRPEMDGVCSSPFSASFQTAWYPNGGVPKNMYGSPRLFLIILNANRAAPNHTAPLTGAALITIKDCESVE